MLNLENLSFSFKDKIIFNDLNLTLKKGKIYSLIGESGVGKTTLIKSISGVLKPTGDLVLNGKSILNMAIEKRPIVTMHQGDSLFPHMNVEDNILYGIRSCYNKKSFVDINEKEYLLKLLNQVELKDHAKAFPSQLSGGQRQRVSLARALAVKPNVLLLDEPFSALNNSLREKLNKLVRKLVIENNIICLQITHNNSDALNFSDYLILMEDNKVNMDDVVNIKYQPTNKFILKYLKNGIIIKDELISSNSFSTVSGSVSYELNIKSRSNLGNTNCYLLELYGQEMFFYSDLDKKSIFKLFLKY